MKERFFLLLFCALYFGATAQYTPIQPEMELQSNCKVYFTPNSYELNKKSIEVIHDFLMDYDALRQAEFRLQAFTDDKGSSIANKLLAKRRAETVQNYFEQEGIVNNLVKVKPAQELILDLDQNAAEQRRENRAVVIELWGMSVVDELSVNDATKISNEGLDKFFEQAQCKAQQLFSFTATIGQIITGEKGTVFHIPPNCFVNKEGNPATGEISLTLQEAYSYGDMIKQNLSTMSGPKMLETGGMFYLAAKDENGAELSIAEGLSITASLPSQEASSSRMQAFKGQKDSLGNVDWQATGRPVLVSNGSSSRIERKLSDNLSVFIKGYRKTRIQYDLEQLGKVPEWNDKLEKEMNKPKSFRMRLPKDPKLRVLTKPSKDVLGAKYPQRTNEKTVDYRKRINEKYRGQQKYYKKYLRKNNAILREFKRDSLEYVRALKKDKKAVDKYMAFVGSRKAVLQQMYDNAIAFEIAEYAEIVRGFVGFSKNAKINKNSMVYEMKSLKERVSNYIDEGYDFDAILEKIEEVNRTQLTSKEVLKLSKCWKEENTELFQTKFYTRKYSTRDLEARLKSLSKLYQDLVDAEKISAYQFRKIDAMREIVEDSYNFKWLRNVNNRIKKSYERNEDLIDRFIAIENTIQEIKNEIQVQMDKFGLSTPEEIADAYGNAMSINSLGWINCDRFYQNTSPKMDMQIITKKKDNTMIFVVFEDIKSIMRANATDKGMYVAHKLPKDQKAKIIGLRILGNGAEVFVEQGTIAELHRVKPVFEKKTLEEVQTLMAET